MADSIPRHVGFIVDGNRRWAKKHGLPAYEGHLAGYNSLHEIVTELFDAKVEYISLYIFSTENWKRSAEEVSKLMGLVLKILTADLHLFEENDIKLKIIGSRQGVSEKIIQAIDDAEARTANNKRGTLVVCFNYGGQLEITDAVKKIVQSGIPVEQITPDTVAEHLYEPEIPSLDLIVRTSGEHRLSNFMLWRAAYSELLFLDKLWPEMTKDDVAAIIKEYSRRDRRIGG